MTKLRAIAFYLPQFHPTPENDKWWGAGFTEWTNVTKARPQFKGHYQPHLPADLGFYDLRVPEIRETQAELAYEYGLFGFCYYHYWFNGTRLLERPFNEVIDSGRPDFPLCLCWANESWRRNWDGRTGEILIEQHSSEKDDRNHIKYLIESIFSDSRYITVNKKPLFLIYRANLFPNIKKTIEIWREEADKAALDGLYLCRVESHPDETGDPTIKGFDAAVEFQPNWNYLGTPINRNFNFRILNKILKKLNFERGIYFKHKIFEYETIVERMKQRPSVPYKRFPCGTPMWDNSPRRKNGANIFYNSTPELYEDWLHWIVSRFQPFSADENFIFINAWNEWAEGNHLEPCMKWGRAYLEATKKVLGTRKE